MLEGWRRCTRITSRDQGETGLGRSTLLELESADIIAQR